MHTRLERRWLHIERVHGLPVGHRQFVAARAGGNRYVDCDYEPVPVRVELDGRLGHDRVLERWRDMARDNAAVVSGRLPLRYGGPT